jgi:hypothetical protein
VERMRRELCFALRKEGKGKKCTRAEPHLFVEAESRNRNTALTTNQFQTSKMLGALVKIIQRQYYRYSVTFGINMLGHTESAIFHTVLLITMLVFLNYAISSFFFFTEMMKTYSHSTNSHIHDQKDVQIS